MSLYLEEESFQMCFFDCVLYGSTHHFFPFILPLYLYPQLSESALEYLNLSKRGRVWIPQLFAVGLSPLFNMMFSLPLHLLCILCLHKRTIKQQKMERGMVNDD